MPTHIKDYKIHGFEYDNGHIVFDVEHFDSDGNSVGKQYYTFQGRVGHRDFGLSWESVIDTIDSIHPRMVSGEVQPDNKAPRMLSGEPYDFTGIELQKNKGQIHKLVNLFRKVGEPMPPKFSPSPRNDEIPEELE